VATAWNFAPTTNARGHTSCAKRRNFVLTCPSIFWLYKCNYSAFVMVSVPPCPAICKSRGHLSPCPIWNRRHCHSVCICVVIPAPYAALEFARLARVRSTSGWAARWVRTLLLLPSWALAKETRRWPILHWTTAKRHLVNLRLKISPSVATIFRHFSGNETSNWGTGWRSDTVVTYLTFMLDCLRSFQFKLRTLRL